MRGFEESNSLSKIPKVSSSVAARRCEWTPIFAEGACGARVGTFSDKIFGVKIRKLIGFGPLHFDPRRQKNCQFVCGLLEAPDPGFHQRVL